MPGADDVRPAAKRPFSREQQATIVHGILIVAVLQLWLLMATMNAWPGGNDSIVCLSQPPAPHVSR